MNIYKISTEIMQLMAMTDAELDTAIQSNCVYFGYAVASGRNQNKWVSYLQKGSMSDIKSFAHKIDDAIFLEASQKRQELTFFLSAQAIWKSELTKTKKISLIIRQLLENQNFSDVPNECWEYINNKKAWYQLFQEDSSAWKRLNTKQQKLYEVQLWDVINRYHIEAAQSFKDVDLKDFTINVHNKASLLAKLMKETLATQLEIVRDDGRLWEAIQSEVSVELKDAYFSWSLQNNSRYMYNFSDYSNLRELTLSWDEVHPYFDYHANETVYSRDMAAYGSNLRTLFTILNHGRWQDVHSPVFYPDKIRLASQIEHLLHLNPDITELLFGNIFYELSRMGFSSLTDAYTDEIFNDILKKISQNIHFYVPQGWFPHLHCEFKEEEALHLS